MGANAAPLMRRSLVFGLLHGEATALMTAQSHGGLLLWPAAVVPLSTGLLPQ